MSVLGLDATRAVISREVLRPSNDVIGNYLQTLGGIYAVLLAFVTYAVWQQFNDARSQVEREASEVTELFRIVQVLPAAVRQSVQNMLHAYCCGVVTREWQIMAASRVHRAVDEELYQGELPRLLDGLWRTLGTLEPSSASESVVLSAATQCFNELCNARTARLSSSRVRMPTTLRWLLYAGALVLVCSTWLFAVDNFAIHAFVSGATAGATAHVLYVVEDLDDCFSGDWQVPRAAFLRARDFMQARGAFVAPTPLSSPTNLTTNPKY
ncbi:MAG: hypothetical protein RL701_1856 [Pseudomonadota bacterium]